MTAGVFWEPQIEALHSLSERYANNNGRIPPQIIQIPTGCGKTTVIAFLPRCIPALKCNVLVVVPTVPLVEQTVISIRQAFKRHQSMNERVIVESVQSFDHLILLATADPDSDIDHCFWVVNIHKLHLKQNDDNDQEKWSRIARSVDVVAIDEAHHVPATMWKSFLQRVKSTPKKVLFTATPFRSDQKPLRGQLCYRYEYFRAISTGLIKNPVIHLLQSNQARSNERRDVELLRKTESLIKREGRKTQAIGYAKNIIDAQRIVGLARVCTSLRVGIWHCRMSKQSQQEVRTQFEREEPSLDMLIQVKMCSEGYDHPPVGVVTFFKVVHSPLVFMQAICRAARTTDRAEKRDAHIVSDDRYCSKTLWDHFKSRADDADLTDLEEQEDAVDDEEKDAEEEQIIMRKEDDDEDGDDTDDPRSWHWWTDSFSGDVHNEMERLIDALENIFPCRTAPFDIKTSGLKVVITKKPNGGKPRTSRWLSREELTERDVAFARLPAPYRDVFISLASYECQGDLVRELDV